MPFTGPGGDYSAPLRDRYQRVLQLAQDAQEGRVSPRGGGGSARIDTSLIEQDDREDAERQRLAMTPGVRLGGSTATRPQSDSPLNVGASQSFERFGDTYSYDPTAAAEEVGSTDATREAAADRTRFESLKKMPGFNERSAARLVFGRGQPLDPEEANRALADFVRQPGRSTAATAIERGASPYAAPFSPGFDQALGERPRAPVRGTADYRAMMQDELAQREERDRREIQLRASLRPAPRDRETKVIGPNGEIGILNYDADGNEKPVTWTGQMGAKPGGGRGGAAGPGRDAMLGGGGSSMQKYHDQYKAGTLPGQTAPGRPAAPPVSVPGAGPVNPDDKAAEFLGGGKMPTPEQIEHARRDPGYKAWLVSKGYVVP